MELNKLKNSDCHRCKQAVTDQTLLRYQKLTFHLQCFTCSRCSTGLEVSKAYFDELSERVWCEKCYYDMMDRCTKCEEEIIGQIIQVDGNRRYHKECFRCAKCKRQLCEYGEVDNKLYCPADYHQLIGPKCFKCHLTIIPDKTLTIQTYQFRENPYHSKCFVCDKCSCSLDDPDSGKKIFFTIQEQKLCKPCALAAKKAIAAAKANAAQMSQTSAVLSPKA